ncbi:NADH-quinone oxidoreductase subunit L [uncultured Paludibaculum sp.]|uniref:NADH-quinone oxidoreductase subunit L n=1 Tax=uncultured Paludibaculum sp. TaxID=1765020 RepID=UPI002AAB3751|nr:NADH-quinone oxidoreductase subunit L [uncultured Paludibaculum sp.]
MNFLDLIWLIPILPLCGAAIMLFWGRYLSKAAIRIISPGAVLLSLILSVGAVLQLSALPERVHQVILFQWLPLLHADMGYMLDSLSSVMILVVTGIGFLIHVYATGYMAHEHGPRDGGYYRFFGYLNLFVFFMLTLVLANNYPLLFVGWEGVGLCSYLLIGFYFNKKSAGDAGKKAFIVNRIGDAGFILGMFFLFQITGSLTFVDVNEALRSARFTPEVGFFGVLSLTALLLFVGATGKSAQIPLYVWLPDAMEGPTPVSALIHAATMVTAGVYMCARSNALFALTPETSHIVAAVGAATAIFAASIGLVQNDIKRVLAYSTVSQLGYMFVAVGVGAYWVGVFHLYTHAFFKALLFLGAGSVIHAMSGEQDMRKMGGLRNKIPITFTTMFIASLAIAGIPGLAGFFSKDEILWQAWSSPLGSKVLWAVGFCTALMTAFYMWRLMFMTFYGEGRMDEHTKHHIHESPKSMTVPLMVLAAGSIGAGWIGMPKVFGENGFFQGLEHWLAPVFETGKEVAEHGAEHHDTSMEWILMGLSIGAALSGIFLARHIYLKMKESDRPTGGALHPILYNKWYVDEIYDFLFIHGLSMRGGSLMAAFDRTVVDGGVNGTAWVTKLVSRISMWWDTWIVDGLVNLSAYTVRALSFPVRFFQTGFIQSYALVFIAGVFAMFGYFWWVR